MVLTGDILILHTAVGGTGGREKMIPPLGDMSGNQVVMVLGAGLIMAGVPLGYPLLYLGVAVWGIFALLALYRQF